MFATHATLHMLFALRGLGRGIGGGGFPWRIVIVAAVIVIGGAISWWRARR